MRRTFSLVIALAIFVGLSGREAAFAAAPIAQAAVAVATSSADCETMAPSKDDATAPCQGMTADCIAKMGCAVPMVGVPLQLLVEPLQHSAPKARSSVQVALPDRITGPEPEPPTHLG